jgi:LPXTG-site transpeptidase (sortase) family protein
LTRLGNTDPTPASHTWTVDSDGPAVTINQASGQADPANSSPINFTVVFSEPVSGFATGDVTLAGTAGATTAIVTEIAPNDGTMYNVAVSGMGGDGTVTASVSAGVAVDASNNGNAASTSADNTVTYNTSAPETNIDSSPPVVTNSQNATFSFSSPAADLAGFECQLDGGGWSACSTPWNYLGLGAGSHTFEVRAFDDAGNYDPSPATYTWAVDLGFPTVLFTSNTVPANNVTLSSGPTQVTVEFSEAVKNDGSAGAANSVVNYLLVEDGANNTFNTLACSAGLAADDTNIVINSASYTNNGGSGPFIATLNINGGIPLPTGTYRLFVCGTTSIEDLSGNELNDGSRDTAITFTVQPASQDGGGGGTGSGGNTTTTGGTTALGGFLIPVTGFRQGEVTRLASQPADKAYASTDILIEIPKLGLKTTIVGVPQSEDGWDVSWLGRNAGWLNGSAFPTWKGNSVITAHVWDAYNKPGPFAGLIDLQYGDQIRIHAYGQVYTYEITESSLILPSSISSAFRHEEKSVLTLITCEGYQEKTGAYTHRRLVRAVLVKVEKAQ